MDQKKILNFIEDALKDEKLLTRTGLKDLTREEIEEVLALLLVRVETREVELQELVEEFEDRVRDSTRELRDKNRLLEELAITDDLTQLYNRRFFGEKLKEYSNLASRYHHPLSCIMVDIDFFKQINDTYGHQAGDYVLFAVAKTLSSNIRRTDVVARYGGEEFVVLMPNTGYETALKVAEKLRKALEKMRLKYMSNELRCTASFGVSSGIKERELHDSLVRRADIALYQAKNSGRNRVMGKKS